MAVAFDAESTFGTDGETGTKSSDHIPSGTPRAVLVLIVQTGGTGDEVTGVTYGGVAMTEVSVSPLLKATNEEGAVYAYFLGSSIPANQQTVVATCDPATGGSPKAGNIFTLTANTDTEIVDAKTIGPLDAAADPSVTLSLGGRTSWCAIGFHSGQASAGGISPNTDWSVGKEFDFGNQNSGFYYYDIVGTTDVSAGWIQTEEDATAIAVAISEAQAGGAASIRQWRGALMGVGRF